MSWQRLFSNPRERKGTRWFMSRSRGMYSAVLIDRQGRSVNLINGGREHSAADVRRAAKKSWPSAHEITAPKGGGEYRSNPSSKLERLREKAQKTERAYQRASEAFDDGRLGRLTRNEFYQKLAELTDRRNAEWAAVSAEERRTR